MPGFKHLVILLLLTPLIACTDPDKPEDTQERPPYQKPGAPIRLATPEYIEIAPNSRAQFTISFSTPEEGRLSIEAKPKAGISIVDNQQWQFSLGQTRPEITFTVDSGEAGQYHIMFFAEMTLDELSMPRTFGIPVYVGETKSAPEKSTPAHAIMKAEETIRR